MATDFVLLFNCGNRRYLRQPSRKPDTEGRDFLRVFALNSYRAIAASSPMLLHMRGYKYGRFVARAHPMVYYRILPHT